MSPYLIDEAMNVLVYWSFGFMTGVCVWVGAYTFNILCAYPEYANEWWNHNKYAWSPINKFIHFFNTPS